jgi:beta-lactam-binding protein with PASTA domain
LLILTVIVAGIRTLGAVRTGAANTAAATDVPALIGLGPGEARDLLRARGLALGRVDAAPLPGQPANVVVYQQPPAGTRVEAGTAINIVIRTAP